MSFYYDMLRDECAMSVIRAAVQSGDIEFVMRTAANAYVIADAVLTGKDKPTRTVAEERADAVAHMQFLAKHALGQNRSDDFSDAAHYLASGDHVGAAERARVAQCDIADCKGCAMCPFVEPTK